MAASLGKAVIFDVAAEGHLLKCQGGDSNPYGFLHQILSLARLPIPPPRLVYYEVFTNYQGHYFRFVLEFVLE
jgi:hypothetical protein